MRWNRFCPLDVGGCRCLAETMHPNPRVRRWEARDPQAGDLRQAACQHAPVADGHEPCVSTHAPAFFLSSCPRVSHSLLPDSRDRPTRRCFFLITRRPPEPGVLSPVEPEGCHHGPANPSEWEHPYPDESWAPTVPPNGYEASADRERLRGRPGCPNRQPGRLLAITRGR